LFEIHEKITKLQYPFELLEN
jgi:hypothetical protein